MYVPVEWWNSQYSITVTAEAINIVSKRGRVAPQQCSENERYVVFCTERGRLELLEDAQFIVLQEPELANVKVERFSGTIHARNPYTPEASAIAICKTKRLSLRAISVC